MEHRTEYILTEDKNGRSIAFKLNVKTGKKSRIGYKKAVKLEANLRYKRKRAEKEIALEEKGSNWKEYQQQKKVAYKEIELEYKESGVKPREGTIDRRAEKEVMDNRVGVRTRFRMDFKFYELPDCGSPIFMADAGAVNGDNFVNAVEYCQDIYDNILESNICPKSMTGYNPIEGGACVVLYSKATKEVISQWDIPKGVGCKR